MTSYHAIADRGFRGAGRVMLHAIIFVILTLPLHGFGQITDNSVAVAETHKQGNWCFTQTYYELMYGRADGGRVDCPTYGDCDLYDIRDSWIPDSLAPFETIRLHFIVFCDDDGDSCVVSVEDLQGAVDSANSYFSCCRFHFEYTYEFIADDRYRILNDWAEEYLMRELYARDPHRQCNIYVCVNQIGAWPFSMGTFPWDARALGRHGGVLMSVSHMPPHDFGSMTHELGHNFGLWHTFHGVTEVSACGSCYESPQAVDRDSVGDFCSDTDPTPLNYYCFPPGGVDTCTGIPWGITNFHNHMSYASWECCDEFTPQQTGRMQCWLRDRVENWVKSADIIADTTIGQQPVSVEFQGIPYKEVSGWFWKFGDGGTTDLQNPVHTYTEPGLYDVSVTIATAQGDYTYREPEFIWIQADTLVIPSRQGQIGQPCRIDIYANNTVPLTELTIPLSWEGPLDVAVDSFSIEGLRTAEVANLDIVFADISQCLAVVSISAFDTLEIPPDTGAVLTLWATLQSGDLGETAPITIETVNQCEPRFACERGDVPPILVHGGVEVCRVGDIDENLRVNIADLTRLVCYLFGGGEPPPNMDAADVNGDGSVNIADLTYFVAYLFGDGPLPVCN